MSKDPRRRVKSFSAAYIMSKWPTPGEPRTILPRTCAPRLFLRIIIVFCDHHDNLRPIIPIIVFAVRDSRDGYRSKVTSHSSRVLCMDSLVAHGEPCPSSSPGFYTPRYCGEDAMVTSVLLVTIDMILRSTGFTNLSLFVQTQGGGTPPDQTTTWHLRDHRLSRSL